MNNPLPPDDFAQRTIPEMVSRGFWMMIGPMLLIPVTFKIIEYGNGWLTVFDLVFMALLGCMWLARAFEFFKGHPRTAEGTPARPEHLRRYGLALLSIGVPLWIAANVLGNYVLRGDA